MQNSRQTFSIGTKSSMPSPSQSGPGVQAITLVKATDQVFALAIRRRRHDDLDLDVQVAGGLSGAAGQALAPQPQALAARSPDRDGDRRLAVEGRAVHFG